MYPKHLHPWGAYILKCGWQGYIQATNHNYVTHNTLLRAKKTDQVMGQSSNKSTTINIPIVVPCLIALVQMKIHQYIVTMCTKMTFFLR